MTVHIVGSRVRVLRPSHADRSWLEVGKPHFLCRSAFESGARQGDRVSMEGLWSVAALLAALEGIRRVTLWTCPAAGRVMHGITAALQRLRQRLGWIPTLLLLLIGGTLCLTVDAVARRDAAALPDILLAWALTGAVLWLWRWWLMRRYRVRVLPARRRRLP